MAFEPYPEDSLRRVTDVQLDATASQNSDMHTIYVDVSIIVRHDAGTGIQRVVRELGAHLAHPDQSHYKVRFVRASKFLPFRFVDDAFLSGHNRFRMRNWLVRPKRGDIFLGLDLSSRILPRHGATIARWRRRGVEIAVIVYDLLPVQHPDWFEERHAEAFSRWLTFVTRYCDHAICISEAVRQALQGWIEKFQPQAASSIRTSAVKLGGDFRASGAPRPLAEREQTKLEEVCQREFVMVVGTIEPRKGHSDLLDAFDLLFKNRTFECPTLLLVGRPGWKTTALQDRIRQHREFGRRLLWVDDASDELVDALYRRASGVIVPSFAEGFGLPLAEAAMHSKKILARDLPVFREQDFSGVTYFQGNDPTALADKIVDWFGTDHYGAQERTPVSWKASSSQLVGILQSNKRPKQ